MGLAGAGRSNNLCLLTRDTDFANVKEYPPNKYAGIVVIRAPDRAGRGVVLGMIERFLRDDEIVDALAGRLAIVEPARIRLRPA